MTGLVFRRAGAGDFAVALDWAAAAGWNPGLDDLAAFHAADPQGFMLGLVEGQPVSSISVVRYGATYGFLGFYIVHPEFRGRGIGLATWHHGVAYLAGRSIGLDGVVDQQDNYRKSGFVLSGRNLRRSGVPAGSAGAENAARIRDAVPGDLPAVQAYDRDFFAVPRDAFVSGWTLPADGAWRRAKIAIVDGEVAGYGVIRACRSGHKIGPLFAEDEDTAGALFLALCATAAGEAVSLDTPVDNAAAQRLAGRFGLRPVFETARMYRGTAPDLPLQRTFGITTFELG